MLADYERAFAGEEADKPFLVYHQVQPDKSLSAVQLSRGEFWDRARRAARCLRLQGVQAGDVQIHFFSANTLGDLLYRLAAVMVGSVPATINWQADTPDRVLHKVRATGARLVLTDPHVPAETLALLRASEPSLCTLDATAELDAVEPLSQSDMAAGAELTPEHSRMIIFTSGTTGVPKGVRLPYRSYACNRATFESFLGAEEPATPLVCVAVNPLHHTNSTAICDWTMRRPGALLHLVQRYTTGYWRLLAAAGMPLSLPSGAGMSPAAAGAVTPEQWARALDVREQSGSIIVAPLVSRHIDFLHTLAQEVHTGGQGDHAPAGEARAGGGGGGGGGGDGLQIPAAVLRRALGGTVLLLGSAPVGPTTVQRLQDHAGRLPTVRFGSTETCLQVMGTPRHLSAEATLASFRAGWSHTIHGCDASGYYIGRPHPPHTDCRIVRSVDKNRRHEPDSSYLAECTEGEPGLIITRGQHVMSGYVGDDDATADAIHEGGWYVNLGDVGFWLTSKADGGRDFYWRARDSALLIKGGANYSYEQINQELSSFLTRHYGLAPSGAAVAVVGLRVASEHEDECCATVELSTHEAQAKRAEIEGTFLVACSKAVSKGSKPDRVRFATIPRNFKGAIQVPDLKASWKAEVAASVSGGDDGGAKRQRRGVE